MQPYFDPTRKMTSKKMEDVLKKRKTTSKKWKITLKKWKTTSTKQKMEDDLKKKE
jgi:hypothetical protein